MRDISFKNTTLRTARARAELRASKETISRVISGDIPKGDPIPVAKVAAIQATKNTVNWIPYCHNIPIEHVDVQFTFSEEHIVAEVYVVSVAKTGVEMEAITAAAAAVITLYDMLKMIDEEMEIGSIRLLHKTGGKSDFSFVSGWTSEVIVMSDRASQGQYEDKSGPILESALMLHGAAKVGKTVLPDSSELLHGAIQGAVSNGTQLVFITGGTGVGPRDISTETLAPLLERELPGVSAAFLSYSQMRMPTSMLARPLAGIIGNTVVIAIPGSPGACKDAMACLFPSLLHLLAMLNGEGHE